MKGVKRGVTVGLRLRLICGLTDWRGGGAPGRLPGSVHPSAMDGRGRREEFLPVVEDSLTGGPSLAVSCREVLPAWALHTPNAAAAALGRDCQADASRER